MARFSFLAAALARDSFKSPLGPRRKRIRRQITHQRVVSSVSVSFSGTAAPVQRDALTPQPKEQTHGKTRTQDREGKEARQGREESRPQAGRSQGARQVINYTLTQAIERTKDLSGELKAARTAKADCAADVEAKDRLAEIARKGLTNAEQHEARLMAERDELADHIATLVRRTGDVLVVDPVIDQGEGWGIAVQQPDDFWNPAIAEGADFQAQALENGLSRITDAYDRATGQA